MLSNGHVRLYVESMIMLSTSCASRISPAHAQLTINIIKRAEEDRPAGSVSDPTFGGVNRLRCRQLADLLVKDAAHSRDHG